MWRLKKTTAILMFTLDVLMFVSQYSMYLTVGYDRFHLNFMFYVSLLVALIFAVLDYREQRKIKYLMVNGRMYNPLALRIYEHHAPKEILFHFNYSSPFIDDKGNDRWAASVNYGVGPIRYFLSGADSLEDYVLQRTVEAVIYADDENAVIVVSR